MANGKEFTPIPTELLELLEVVEVTPGKNSGLIWNKRISNAVKKSDNAGYIRRPTNSTRKDWLLSYKEKNYYVARIIYYKTHGIDPGNLTIDHIDRDSLNNNIENLRLANGVDQALNKTKTVKNTSGAKGVSWFKRDKKWQAQIKIDGKSIYLGIYECKKEAALAYNNALKSRTQYDINLNVLNNIKTLSCNCVKCTNFNARQGEDLLR